MTRVRLNRIIKLAGAGMILCWFDVLNTLLMPAVSRAPLPSPQAALILALAACIAALARLWSLRVIGFLLLHLFGLTACLALVLHHSGHAAMAIWDLSWMTRGPDLATILTQWLIFTLNVLWTILLYYLGFDLNRQKVEMRTVSIRLDIGITAMFVALLVKLIAKHKGVEIPFEHTMGRQLACFLMLGLFSIGVVRNRASHRNSTVSYYKGAGMVLSFGLAGTVFGAAMIMLFLPDLIRGALWGKRILDRSWPHIEYTATLFANSEFMANWIRAVFAPMIAELSRVNPSQLLRSAQSDPNPAHIHLALGAGSIFLVVLWFVAEWLLMKPVEKKRKPGPWVVLRIMARRLKRIVVRLVGFLFRPRDPLRRVEDYYRRLQVWGERSGLPRVAHETPNEYGARLTDCFPGLGPEIGLLVAMFNLARFRGAAPGADQFKQVRSGWKRLCSPVLWPVRARLWLFQARM